MTASRRVYLDDPRADWEDVLRFRLTYEGPLLAESSDNKRTAARATDKQRIRKAFHPQLRALWERHPALYGNMGKVQSAQFVINKRSPLPHGPRELAERFAICGYNFVPLVTESVGLMCGLDILLLRNDPPGSVVSGGDIDNRVKTLLDGLTMPKDGAQLGDYKQPGDDEQPFFVLLEDDKLITRLVVETDTLLEPVSAQPTSTDSRVIITVTVSPFVFTADNYGFA